MILHDNLDRYSGGFTVPRGAPMLHYLERGGRATAEAEELLQLVRVAI